MASKLAFRGLMEVSKPIGKHIRSGRPIPVVVGLIAGALLGAAGGYSLALRYAFPVALVGGMVGAGVAAACFKRQLALPRPAGWFGDIVETWESAVGPHRFHVTLTDHAIFSGQCN